MTTYIHSTEASRLLGVTKPTLYAYVSRGLLTRRTAPDGRTSLYARGEVEQLARRSRRNGGREAPTIDVEIVSTITRLDEHQLTYRGLDVAELAEHHSFEAVAELLWSGELPAHPIVWPVDRALVDRVDAAVAALGGVDPIDRLMIALIGQESIAEPGGAPAVARRTLAAAPALLGSRRSRGDLAERLTAAWRPRPSRELVVAVRRALVLLADHELASSTLAVRVAASVRASPAAAMVAGLAVVSGPAHGGASRAVLELLHRAAGSGAREATHEILAAGARLPGFGHSIYRRGDPRLAPLLEAVAAIPDPGNRYAVVDAVLAEAGRTVGRPPNVDLGVGALMFVGELPPDVPLFATARLAGWAAHYAEELDERPVRFRGITRPS